MPAVPVPCPNCSCVLPIALTEPHVVNLPNVSFIVVSHSVIVKCQNCGATFTPAIANVPQLPIGLMLVEIKEKSMIQVVPGGMVKPS